MRGLGDRAMADDMTSGAVTENKAIVARFFEIFSSGDVPALLDAMADGGKLVGFGPT